MNFYLLDDDQNILTILKLVIGQNGLGNVVGSAESPLDALEDLRYCTPDIVIVDLLMPDMDGITFVKKAKVGCPTLSFVMLSQVSSKEMIAEAYEAGVSFFIQKPINATEVCRVLKLVADNLTMRRTFDQVHSLLSGAPSPTEPIKSAVQTNPTVKEEGNGMKRLYTVLGKLGITGETGSNDIIGIISFMLDQAGDCSNMTTNDLFSQVGNPKAVEQRLRRTIGAGMVNLASIGLEDYDNEVFRELANTLYGFDQIRREMDHIRGKSLSHGKISIKGFLNALYFYCAQGNS